jgi:hypothetical protein
VSWVANSESDAKGPVEHGDAAIVAVCVVVVGVPVVLYGCIGTHLRPRPFEALAADKLSAQGDQSAGFTNNLLR